MTTFLMEKMSHDLTLSSDQQALIAPIISNTTARIRALHRETSKQVEAAMKTSHDEIRPLLDTEQLGKLAEMETRRAKWMRDRGFGPRTNPFSGKAPSKRNDSGSNSLPENLPLSSPVSSASDNQETPTDRAQCQ
jgi:hypothetical protein